MSCQHCGLPVPGARHGGAGPWFCCFGCRFAHRLATPSSDPRDSSSPASTHVLRLGLGIFLALNIMVASWLSYSQEIFGDGALAQGVDAVLPSLFSYLALFLCTLLVAILGVPLFSDALFRDSRIADTGLADTGLDDTAKPQQSNRHRVGVVQAVFYRINAQTLIVIGVLAAYLLSVLHTLRGDGSLYYDTAAMVLVIVTLGSYLEAGAKRRAATAAGRLLAILPGKVRVQRNGTIHQLPPHQVRPGDLVQVRPGDTLPVDGMVDEGRSRIDESSLTGESAARTVESGEIVLAGTVALDGQLWLRAQQVGDDTVLALMERSLIEARGQRPPSQRLADRIAAFFVPLVVVLALGALGVHASQGQTATGLLTALSVLLISCPCALGLAAPLACWHGLRRAAENGILIDSAATLERVAAIDHLVFDKTGTLTQPEPILDEIALAPSVTLHQALTWASGLESASTHPIARSLLELASSHGIVPPRPLGATAVPGRGVKGTLDGRLLRLGSLRWAKARGLAQDPRVRDEPSASGAVYLMADAPTEDGLKTEECVLARFELTEALRHDARRVVTELRELGVEVSILSGDQAAPTRRVAETLEVEATPELLPADKVSRLTAARRAGGCWAMVGDGINDAPVLAAADIGIAIGSASDLAARSGNIRLLSDRLDGVSTLLRIGRDTRRRIRSNLLWAFSFNSVGIGLALTGWLTPVFAAAAMVLSSLTVVRISSSGSRRETRASTGTLETFEDSTEVSLPIRKTEPELA